MKDALKCLVGIVLLGSACIVQFHSERIPGRTINAPSLLELRGGGCDHNFVYDNSNPVFCPGSDVGCSKTIPSLQGEGKSGLAQLSCGTAAGCGTYAGPSDCATGTMVAYALNE